ncbi:MAG: DUF1007 family protein [Litoreibacter sp.]|nr:DUF1007 family protein [Litoreibacter sp.]MCY4334107.1 DUF1007 family protein [Litoreibacter sp.]
MFRAALIPLALAAPAPALAHPHIFIDTGLEVIFDEAGRLTHVKVTWEYDAFYSLLTMEERGLDPDYDGVLTAEEEAALSGFDAQWIPGFNGDLVGILGDTPLDLSGPLKPTARVVEGQIITTHLREVKGTPLLEGEQLSFKPYDETFYTAYEVTGPVKFVGLKGCETTKRAPDIEAMMRRFSDLLLTLDTDITPEDAGLPPIGEAFATEVTITCPAF